MSITLLAILLGLSAAFMALERAGVPTTVSFDLVKGDIKRGSRWLAQFGDIVSSGTAALIIWRLDRDPAHRLAPLALLLALGFSAVSAFIIKRLVGRVRPGREHAGKFLGPGFRHANYRESFPSSHSAAAAAMAVVLAALYPPAAPIFWALALICAALRYVMEAHWPSDIAAGLALGYASGYAAMVVLMGKV